MADKGSSSSSETGESKNSSNSSGSEEERLRRLFNSCDADGDGYLDGCDFAFMCRMLNMGDSVNEIRAQLGMTEDSRISFDDFLRYRTRVFIESSFHPIEHNISSNVLISGGEDTGVDSDASGILGQASGNQLTSWPTLSSDSLAMSCSKPESADYDSGARDLSPEPAVTMTLTQLMEVHDPRTLLELRQSGADSSLDIINRLHAASLTSLKGEICELKTQIYRMRSEKAAQDSCCRKHTDLSQTDFEDRLEQLTSRYEERIIELHSVIAELRKKVERHQINVIREEDEFEESEQGQSTQSNDGESLNEKDEGNDIGREFTRVVQQIENTLSTKTDQPTPTLTQSFMEGKGQDILNSSLNSSQQERDDKQNSNKSNTDEDVDVPPQLPPRANRLCPLQHAAGLNSGVSEELRAVKGDNEELRQQVSHLEVELGQMSENMTRVVKDREILSNKVKDLQLRLQSVSLSDSPSHSRVSTPTKQSQTPPPVNDRRGSDTDTYPVAKMAQMKKLKTSLTEKQGLGVEITQMGIESTKKAEHLVQSIQDDSHVAEMLQQGLGKGGDPLSLHAVSVKEFEVELERRQAKIDHLRAQSDVVSATLDESKSYAERLCVLMGKYESNNTALQLSSAYADNCLEAQDVLIALLDAEMGVLLANCRAAGLGGLALSDGCNEQEEVTAILQRAHHARRRAEGVARHLMSRLDRHVTSSQSSGGGSSGQPWEDMSTNSRTTSTSSTSSSSDVDFSKLDEAKLRETIQHFKGERAAVRTTVMELESVHVDPVINEPRRRIEAQRLDLENAVLVQELMAVKEEKAELKAKSYLLEKEKRALELRVSGKETQEQVYRLQIEHLKEELREESPTPSTICPACQAQTPPINMSASNPELKPRPDIELTKALNREHTLKERVGELMKALDKISRNSESRQKQSAEFVGDLKRANSALISAFERAKKKYQTRVKKMEGQLTQAKDRITYLEGSRSGSNRSLSKERPQPNETAL